MTLVLHVAQMFISTVLCRGLELLFVDSFVLDCLREKNVSVTTFVTLRRSAPISTSRLYSPAPPRARGLTHRSLDTLLVPARLRPSVSVRACDPSCLRFSALSWSRLALPLRRTQVISLQHRTHHTGHADQHSYTPFALQLLLRLTCRYCRRYEETSFSQLLYR